MFDAVYSPKAHTYSMRLRGFRYSYTNEILFVWDSGSPYTVLSLDSMYDRSSKNRDAILRIFESQKVSTIQPISATGHLFKGYACLTRDITLSGKHLDEFYFYIVPSIGKPLSLIGDDIISFCTFHHQKKSDINNIGFDEEGYISEFKSLNHDICDLDILLGLLDMN